MVDTDFASALPIRGSVKTGEAINADNTSVIVAGSDGSNYFDLKTDGTGVLLVNAGGGVSNTMTFDSDLLVKGTPNPILSAAGPIVVKKVYVSGSGLMKVEVQTGVTASETTKAVFFNSAANPNVVVEFDDGLDIATGSSVVVLCSNLETRASPGSDFTAYGTIVKE
jgi:hypothetical protein